MKIEPYGKHQLYKGYYEMLEGGVIKIPDKCRWVVKKYKSNCEFGSVDEQGETVLLLNEDYTQPREYTKEYIAEGTDDYIVTERISGFWSVISFLTPSEAKELAEQLLKAGGFNYGNVL